MKRLRECIAEGLEDKYGAYKSKVLDTLASVGIVIDPSKMKHAEEWIKDFYDDKMSSFDCASSIRDNFSRISKITESFEKYATEIVNSAPALQKKRAVKRIKAMDRVQKAQFDHVVLTLCGLKNLDPREFLASRGYDILKLVQDGYLSVDEIIERIGQQLLSKKNESMSVEEALEIIRESGRRADKTNTDSSDWMDMCKREMIKLGYGPVTADSYVTDEWRGEFIRAFKDGYTPKEAAEQMHRFLEEQEHDESY